jgi:hypothetical protein
MEKYEVFLTKQRHMAPNSTLGTMRVGEKGEKKGFAFGLFLNASCYMYKYIVVVRCAAERCLRFCIKYLGLMFGFV